MEARNAGLTQAVSLMRGRRIVILERDEAPKRLVARATEEKDEVIGTSDREMQWLGMEAGLVKPSPSYGTGNEGRSFMVRRVVLLSTPRSILKRKAAHYNGTAICICRIDSPQRLHYTSW